MERLVSTVSGAHGDGRPVPATPSPFPRDSSLFTGLASGPRADLFFKTFIFNSFYVPTKVLPPPPPFLPTGKGSREELTEFDTLIWGRIKPLPSTLSLSMAHKHIPHPCPRTHL